MMVGLIIRLIEVALTISVIVIVGFLVRKYGIPLVEYYIARYNQESGNNGGFRNSPVRSRPPEPTPTIVTKNTKNLKLFCPECTRGQIIEDKTGAICSRCGAEYSKEQVGEIRHGATPKPQRKPDVVERKKVEITLDNVKIGWLETTFLPRGDVMKRGSIDAYYYPDPSNSTDDRFIGDFDDWDTAHSAVEKAFYMSQQQKQQEL